MNKKTVQLFKNKYLGKAKVENSAYYIRSRSIHGARIIKFFETLPEERSCVIAKLYRMPSSNFVWSSSSEGQGILHGSHIIEIKDNIKKSTEFYFCINGQNDNISTDENSKNERVFKINLIESLKNSGIWANDCYIKDENCPNDEYNEIRYLNKNLTTGEDEIEN